MPIHPRHAFTPSPLLIEPKTKAKAELLIALLLCRLGAVLVLVSILAINNNDLYEVLSIVAVINLGAYCLAKQTRFYLGAYLVLAEPLIALTVKSLTEPANVTSLAGGAMWLAIGTVMSSLILPVRQTVYLMGITLIVLVILSLKIDPQFRTLMATEALTVMAVSCLALVGRHLLDEADKNLQLERAKVLQSSKLASLGEMASGVAHELNSPLGAIVLSTEMIEEMIEHMLGEVPNIKTDAVLSEVADEIRSIGSIAERMSKIINGLKTFAREADQEEIVEAAASSWISDSLDLCRQRFHNAGVRVEVVPNDLETICAVQPIQMTQILVNLLSNAFDAVEDKQEKWIRIEAVKTNSHFELRVTDSGVGIPREAVEKIFEPFFTTKDYSRGTGLGLSISKGIAQHHGGDLIYDVKAPHTCFLLKLPLLPSAQTPVENSIAS